MKKIANENKNAVLEQYPSICWNCENARMAASLKNENAGLCGCTLLLNYEEDKVIQFIKDGDLYKGWVNLKSPPFEKRAGVITNFQLLTKGVQNCTKYIENED